MSQVDLAEAREWLEIVYSSAPGKINICATREWAGRTFDSTDIDGALAYIQDLDQRSQPNDDGTALVSREGIYLRATTLRRDPDQGSRGGDDLSFYLPGLWADIDIAGPGHKSKGTLPPDVAGAMAIVAASGLPEPSHWIHSGGGLYPWWLLRNPAQITDLEDFRALSSGWQQALLRGAEKLGYTYGSGVGDLSRVLRIPGTVNRKAGLSRPCTMLEGHAWSGSLYDLEDLVHALATVTPEPPKPSPIEIKMASSSRDGERPGDEFNRTASWHDILLPHGWQWVRKMGDTWYLRRPGKMSGGHSATIRDSTERLWVFSEEAQPFEAFKLYSKFAAYASLEHHGDFGSATKALAARGYGRSSSTGVVRVQPAATSAVELVPMPVPPPSPAAPDAIGKTVALKPQRDALGIPVYEPQDMRGMSWDSLSLSDKWVDIHKDTFAYLANESQWMMWNQDRWIPDDRLRHEHATKVMVGKMLEAADQVKLQDEALGKIMAKEARKHVSNTGIQSIIKNSRSNPQIVATTDDFDKDPNLVTVANGVLNLSTMTLSAHDPSMMLTRKINASYDPQTEPGRWDRFMREVLPDQQVREYLQRVCGYMLTGQASERIMVLLYGDSGTGKTQFLEALREVMGDFAGVTPSSAFQPRTNAHGPSDDLHKLRGKRLAIQSELDAGSRLNEALVKSIVGSDTQTTRPLYGKYMDWRPEYTAFLATNHLPRISSSENAIWNRVKPIQFGQVFINEQGQALHPEDRNLGRRMAAEDATGILNWLLEGLAAYRTYGLAEPAQVTTWLTQYREDVDSCRQFLVQGPEDGQIEVEPQAKGKVREIYRSYVAWCQDNGITPLGLRNFNARLESAGFVRKRAAGGIMWHGIGLATGEWIAGTQSPVGFGAFRQRE